MMQLISNDQETLTALMQKAWQTISNGQDIIAESEALEIAAADSESVSDDMTVGPRTQAAWDRRAVGEDTERRGEAMEAQVGAMAEAADIDMVDVLALLVAARSV